MSKVNPTKSIDALLAADVEVQGLKIQKLTIGRYCLLELLDSPFINPEKKILVSNIMPSLYVMTQDIEKLCDYDSSNIKELRKAAMIWSEEVDIKNVNDMILAVLKKINEMNDVAPDAQPEGTGTNSKKK